MNQRCLTRSPLTDEHRVVPPLKIPAQPGHQFGPRAEISLGHDFAITEGIGYHNSVGDNDLGSCHLKLEIIVHQCPSCKMNNLDFVVQRLTDNDWQDVNEKRIIHQTEEKLDLTK